MFKTLPIFLCLFSLWAAPVGDKKGQKCAKTVFERNPNKTTETFPGTPLPFSIREKQAIREAHSLRDLFKPVQAVLLESTPSSLLGQVTKAVFHGGYWFVLDGADDLVYRFSAEGKFLGLLGGKGRGPGEYLNAFQIRVTPDGDIALLDGALGPIKIYDPEGHYIRDINLFFEQGRIGPPSDFIWHKNSLFICDVQTILPSPPYGIVFLKGETLEPSFGFGETIVDFSKAPTGSGIVEYLHEGFAMVGNRIWCGSPYDIDIQVYDLQGRWLGELPKDKAEAIHREDFKELDLGDRNAKKTYRKIMGKIKNGPIFQNDRYVLASIQGAKIGRMFYVYDKNGNLLKKDLKMRYPFWLVGSYDFYFIAGHGPEYMVQGFEIMSPEFQKIYLDAGYDPKKPHENPFLLLLSN